VNVHEEFTSLTEIQSTFLKKMIRLSRHWPEKLWNGCLLLWGFCGLVVHLLRRYPTNFSKIQQTIAPLLATEQHTLPRLAWQRIKTYVVALGVMEHLFVSLQGQSLTAEQTRRVQLLAGLVPLFDDLLDHYDYTREEIAGLSQLAAQRGVWEEKICLALFREGGFAWSTYWDQVVDYQLKSRSQVDGQLDLSALRDVTFGKGGHSVLLGWHLVGGESGGAPLREAVFEFGAAAQLLDDVFDLWHDLQNRIQTLATDAYTVATLTAEYQAVLTRTFEALRALPYPRWRVRRTLLLCLLPLSLGNVALWHLADAERRHQGVFQPASWTRSELVCDMARWRNRFRWAWVVWRML
jgi:hypothetical protein